MYNRIRAQILKLMRVPADPEPPIGAPGSVRTFRAGRNYYYVRLLRWGIAQIGAAIGILVSIGFLMKFTADVENHHARRASAASAPVREARSPADLAPPAETRALPSDSPQSAVAPPPANEASPPPAVAPGSAEPTQKKKGRRVRGSRDGYAVFVSRTPMWLVRVMNIGELVGIALFLAQIPITFIAARLEFELRWYIVTDRSLRIRAGLASLQESTMSFANLQQVEVRQGPLQRLLGIADVRVQSAGGGGGGGHKGTELEDSLHTGVFHGVDNAQEIRDLILDRLKAFREAGLGDPEDAHAHAATTPAGNPGSLETPPLPSANTLPASDDALAAARELLAEARALRRALSGGG